MGLCNCTLLILLASLGRSLCQTACGGDIKDKTGIISSPNFPSSYPDSSNCHWTLHAPENQVLYIRFLHVDFAASYNNECADYVSVFDGDTYMSPIIIQLCGYKTPEEVAALRFRSTGKNLYINFYSDYSQHNSGFDAQFAIQDCPPFTFGNETCNKQCICAQSNTRHCNSINGTCICKQGWTGPDCSIDIDECRSDVVEACPDNYQLCVNTPGTFTCQCKPGMVMNSTGQCEVAASSRCSVKICSHVCAKLPSGIEQCYCPMDMHLIGNQCKDCDHLSFGENCRLGCNCSASNTERCYAPTGDCQCKPGWRGSTCSDDIDECSLAIQRCVGNTTCINTIGSYYCAACNNVITATSGVLVSQNHPNNYPNNLNCSWLIISPNKQATISLRFSEIDLQYWYDVVSIFDGTNTAAPRIAVFNSRENHNNVFIRSTQSKVFILFETDSAGVGTGFSGTFQVEETPGCGQVISNVSGSLTLQKRPPLIPGNVFFCYLSFVDQQSELYTVKLQSLELGRSLDCNNGYLKVYNLTRGTRLDNYDYQKYCYNNIPSLIRSDTREMLIIYFLNESGTEPKFNATYLKTGCNWKYGDKCQSDCKCNRSYTNHCNNLNGHCECSYGMKETDCSQDINECTELSSSCTAPTVCRNMFQSYECDLNKTQIHGQFDCISNNVWRNGYYYYHVFIKGPPNNVVSLSVSNFNMTYTYGSTKCVYYMDIYDGMDRNSRLIGHYCESKIPKLLRTTQNVMLIIIENTSWRNMCHAEYQIEPCAPFMYGPACSRMCPCLKENTLTCDNLYGVCHCKAGWTGKDCSTDLDECLYVKNCTQNSECTNTPGSYQCVCVDGYEKDTSGRLCTPSMQCPEQDRNRCSHACVLVAGKPQCRCPPNLVLDETEQLNCVAPFYSPFGEVIHFAQGEKHSKLPLNVKVPFGFNKVVTSVFVSRQGVVLFDNNQHVNLSIHEAALHDIKLAAPLWSQFDLERGNVSYYFIERCRLDDTQRALTQTEVQMVERARKSVTEKNAFYDFEVKTLLVLTWQDLQLPQEHAKFTFQAIYISGYEKQILQGQPVSLEKETGHIIFIYHKGKDHWTSTAPAAIGFTTGDMENDITKLNPNVLSVLGSSQFDLNAPGVMVFNVGYADGPEQKCEQYLCQYSAFKDSDFYRDEINELYKCPCSSERLGFQWDLYETRGDIDCYAIKQGVKNRFLPSNSRNKLCCYPRPSSLCDSSQATKFTSYLQNDPNGGHVLIADPWLTSVNRREALNNLEAHKSCCLHSSSQMCHQFYQLFPDMECSVQVTFVSPFALGDPHITTLDGLTYAMNGWGEYNLLAVPSKHFVLQARTGRVVSNKGPLLNATVFTAFAARQSTEASFQVELSLSNTTMNIYIDGQDVTNEFYKSRSYRMSSNSISVSREVKCQNKTEKNSVKVKFSSGVVFEVTVGVKSLDIMMQVDLSLKNQTTGLMGNFNGKISDEFHLPDGRVLSVNSSERDIFTHFVSQYSINTSTTVFIYEAGEGNKDYQHPEFIPMFLDELDPKNLTAARNYCGADNFPCIYDFIATDNPYFVLNTKETKEESVNLVKRLENKIPKIQDFRSSTYQDKQWLVTKGKINNLQVVAVDGDGDALTFIVESSLNTLTISNNGLITYTPFDIPEHSLKIKVMDTNGGYSATNMVPLSYCSGCSSHGICTNSSTLLTKETGVGVLKCHCYPAFIGEHCESEFDACSLSPCQGGRTCTDLTADQQGNKTIGYTCGPCPTGFNLGTEDNCLDINECNGTSVCDQLCTNTYGSYRCSCRDGFRQDPVYINKCIDINECDERTALCQQGCVNTQGNYTCTCSDGYHLHSDGLHCILNFDKVAACKVCQQMCTVNQTKVTCSCNTGYKTNPSDATKCIDVDECTEGNTPCSQVCSNIEGHYKCSCYSGYEINADGLTCTACKIPHYGSNCNSTCDCGLNGHCDPVRGCVCQKGWTGEKCSIDVNECNTIGACPSGQLCRNTVGSYQCLCQDGYRMIKGACQDIDECSDIQVTFRCNSELGETCVNTMGSYMCQCRPGFYRNQFLVCEDINECESHIDGCEQVCENTPGSFNCKCHPGYYKSTDRKHCINVKDICKNKNMTCSHNCTVDENGSPYCFCPRGFDLIGSTRCQDINECASTTLNLCLYKEGCRNTEGGFTCSCPAGQRLDNDLRTCIDCEGETWGINCANECSCGINADHCDLKSGCVCKSGFQGDHCDEDIDECISNNMHCPSNEICVNTPGSAECQCRNGFTRQNGICTDVDECQDRNLHVCSQNCTNTLGSYTCSCYVGYTLDAVSNDCIAVSTSVIHCDSATMCEDHLQCSNEKCLCYNGLLPESNGNCIDCNRVLTASTGTIMSSNYPLTYPYDSKCTWTITSNNVNSIISLRFQDYEVEGCPYDYVELFDGNSSSAKQLDSLCYSVPEVIKSSGNFMHIVFTSDNSNNKKGFLATYAIEDFCKQKRCSHTCKVTSTNPWTETCTCPEWMTLDSSGEHCYVTNACNSTIQSHSGYIVSPNYPHTYPDSTSCFWRIEGGLNSRVTLSFSDFRFESNDLCTYDYMSVHDGDNEAAPLLSRYCSHTIPPTVVSTNNYMYIVFHSDASVSNKGFKAFFNLV